MADLLEKQFELDGKVFGWGCPVDIHQTGFRPGGNNVRGNDVNAPHRDGVRPGADWRGSEVWGFSLFTNGEDEVGGWDAYTNLKTAWDADAYRLEPGEVTPLRYRLGGATRRVYGRPRRWTPALGEDYGEGRVDIEADFEVTYPQIYDDEIQTAGPISIGDPLDIEAGFMVPFTTPFTSTPSLADRVFEVVIGGDEDTRTPVWVTFEADGAVLTNPQVNIGDWVVKVEDVVYPNDPVTVDGRPWQRTALRKSGGGVRLTPRVTRLSRMWLPPGRHSVLFSGEDPSSSATVTVSWRNARRSPR